MANKTANGSKFVISSADTFFLGNASMEFVGTYSIHLVAAGWTGSITVKTRSMAPGAASDSVTPVPVCYTARYLNGAVGTDSVVSTAITTTSLINVPCSGQAVVLDCTSFSAGTMTVYAVPVLGVG